MIIVKKILDFGGNFGNSVIFDFILFNQTSS